MPLMLWQCFLVVLKMVSNINIFYSTVSKLQITVLKQQNKNKNTETNKASQMETLNRKSNKMTVFSCRTAVINSVYRSRVYSDQAVNDVEKCTELLQDTPY